MLEAEVPKDRKEAVRPKLGGERSFLASSYRNRGNKNGKNQKVREEERKEASPLVRRHGVKCFNNSSVCLKPDLCSVFH